MKQNAHQNKELQVLAEAEATSHFWVKSARRWWAFHYSLGIFGTVCSITVASAPQFLQSLPTAIQSVAWLAAIAIGLMTFLMPSRKARVYVSAARLLGDALRRYQSGEDRTLKSLNDAIHEGEKIISMADHP